MSNITIPAQKIETSIGVVIIPEFVSSDVMSFSSYLRQNWGFSNYNVNQLKKNLQVKKKADYYATEPFVYFSMIELKTHYKQYIFGIYGVVHVEYDNYFINYLIDKGLKFPEVLRKRDEVLKNIMYNLSKNYIVDTNE